MRDEIEIARKELGIAVTECSLVAPHLHTEITEWIGAEFTTIHRGPLNYYWWWERFREPQRGVMVPDPVQTAAELLDPDDCYWFLAEAESDKRESTMWLYEMIGRVIPRILRETHPFEYYIVDRKMTWLLCENHHGVLIGVGETIVNRMPEDSGAL